MFARLPRILRVALVLLLLAPAANAAGEIVRRPAGAVIVPDQFLRSWDPVSLFFDTDTGLARGGPEGRPERVVNGPAHPGAYTWIDARTLQFRPAEPWPALSRLSWTVGGVKEILWHVDGHIYVSARPGSATPWRLEPGGHRFQVSLPDGNALTRPVTVTVE